MKPQGKVVRRITITKCGPQRAEKARYTGRTHDDGEAKGPMIVLWDGLIGEGKKECLEELKTTKEWVENDWVETKDWVDSETNLLLPYRGF